MSDLAIIFLVLGGLWLVLCLISIFFALLWLECRDARRPEIEEHTSEFWS